MVKKFGRFLRQNTIAMLALFLVLGGSSYAAATAINGKSIKPNSIPKNRLTKTAIRQLKGNRGAQGAQGAQGARGATGLQGPAGPFPTGNLPGGVTLRGDWMNLCDNNEPTCWSDISFGYQMAAPLAAQYVIGTAPPNCPGAGQAAAGHLCVYETQAGDLNEGGSTIFDEGFNSDVSGRWGALIRVQGDGAGAYYYGGGTWAATSPAGLSSTRAPHPALASPHDVTGR
jgi:hypothetical protein